MKQMLVLSEGRRSITFPGAVIILLLVTSLISMSVWALITSAASQQPSTEPAGSDRVSPLLFGTNPTVDTEHDQWLTSPEARQTLKNMGITFIRVPMRKSVPTEVELKAISLIKEMGMTPLIILHQETRHPDALQDNSSIIQGTNKIFGNEVVYYEYGNEPDCPCGGEESVSIEEYTASWNKVVPELKKVATNGKFIGPVLMEYSEEKALDFQHFITNAKPQPDIVSWHAYTCALEEPESACIADIDAWTDDFRDARVRMNQVLGKELPIMVTEYNYTPHLQKGQHDGKDLNKAFMTEWTTKALQVLAQNNIFGANQYAATNTPIPLTDAGALGIQGEIFRTVIASMQSRVGPLPTASDPCLAPTTGTETTQPTPATTVTTETTVTPVTTETPEITVTPSVTETPTTPVTPVTTETPEITVTPVTTETSATTVTPVATEPATPTETATDVAEPVTNASAISKQPLHSLVTHADDDDDDDEDNGDDEDNQENNGGENENGQGGNGDDADPVITPTVTATTTATETSTVEPTPTVSSTATVPTTPVATVAPTQCTSTAVPTSVTEDPTPVSTATETGTPSSTETPTVIPSPTDTTGITPTPTVIVTPAPVPSIPVAYSFEAGSIDGWTGNEMVRGLSSISDQGNDGTHSLKVDLGPAGDQLLPTIFVRTASGRLVPQEGHTLTAYVKVPPECTGGLLAQWYVKDVKHTWYQGGVANLTAGNWQTLTYQVASMKDVPIELGLRFHNASNCPSVYVDSISQTS